MMNTTDKKSVDDILAMLRDRPKDTRVEPWEDLDSAIEINKHNLKIRMDQFARHLSGEYKRYDADHGTDLLYYSMAYLLAELYRYNQLHEIDPSPIDMEYSEGAIDLDL